MRKNRRKRKKALIFLRWPIEDMPHFFVFVFVSFFVVVFDRAIKIKLSRDK